MGMARDGDGMETEMEMGMEMETALKKVQRIC